MKKIKLLFLATLLLITVLVLASCGATEFAELVDEEAAPVANPAYQSVTQVSSLMDMEKGDAKGNLQVFTKKTEVTLASGELVRLTKTVVYDLVNNSVVWSKEENPPVENLNNGVLAKSSTSYEVSLDTIEDATFFKVKTVVKTTYNDGVTPDSEKSSLVIYAWNGGSYAEIASAADYTTEPQVQKQLDLLFFENKFYRVDENNAITLAFEYPVFAKIPSLKYSTENYYVSEENGKWITYDKELNRVSAFQAPSYENEEFSVVFGDKIFMQTTTVEDPYSNKYDLITVNGSNVQKKTLNTFMIDVEDAKTKSVRCSYMVKDDVVISADEEWAEDYGLAASKKEVVLVKVAKIDDKREDTSEMAMQWAILNERGQINVIEVPTAMQVKSFKLVAADTWMLTTIDDCVYLVDAEGEIKGEITKKEYSNDAYIVAGGKIYNYNLEMVYDYKAEKLSLETQYSSKTAVYLTNADGELFIFANGQKLTLIGKGAKCKVEEHNETFVVIKDSSTDGLESYKIYNSEGTLLKSDILINTATGASLDEIAKVSTTKDGSVTLIMIKMTSIDATTGSKTTTTYYSLK